MSAAGERADPDGVPALVARVADGEAIDWAAELAAAGDAEARAEVAALQAIEAVASAHRSWLATGGFAGGLDDDDDPLSELAQGAAGATRWGDLEILDVVGRGGFGTVYRARDPKLDRIVALKLIRRSDGAGESDDELLREGRLLARVRHEHVAQVYGADRRDGRVGFWMEFLSGRTLAETVAAGGPLSAKDAARAGVDLCRALAAVHHKGIVHRDVKAQNVIREEGSGRIVLTDFGIGRETSAEAGAASLSGTPLYLAPELFEGAAATPASDLYALGVLLFYLATGTFPVEGASFEALRETHRAGRRKKLREVRKDLPAPFVAAVERALAGAPGERGGLGELERVLASFLDRDERWLRRARWAAAIALAACIVAAVGLLRRPVWKWWILRQAEALYTSNEEKGAERAIDLLKQATAAHPDFAEGWSRLGFYRTSPGQQRLAFFEQQTAYLLIGGSGGAPIEVSPAWRARIEGHHALACLDYKRAIERFKEAVASDQRDVASWRQIGMAHANLGEPRSGFEAALRARSLAPGDPVAVGLYPLLLAEDSRGPDALRDLDAIHGPVARAPYLAWPRAIAHWAVRDFDGALRAFEALGAAPDFASYSEVFRAQTLLYRGGPGDADQARGLLESGAGRDHGGDFDRNVEMRRLLIAEVARRDGAAGIETTRGRIEAFLDTEGAEPVPINLKLLRAAGVIAARAGFFELAGRSLASLRQLDHDYKSAFSSVSRLQVEAEIALARGQPAGTIELLDAAQESLGDPFLQTSRVKAYIAQGNCAEARRIADGLATNPGRIAHDYFYPWVYVADAIVEARGCLPHPDASSSVLATSPAPGPIALVP